MPAPLSYLLFSYNAPAPPTSADFAAITCNSRSHLAGIPTPGVLFVFTRVSANALSGGAFDSRLPVKAITGTDGTALVQLLPPLSGETIRCVVTYHGETLADFTLLAIVAGQSYGLSALVGAPTA